MAEASHVASTSAATTRVGLRWPLSAATTVIAINVALIAIIVGIFLVLCVNGYQTTLVQAEGKAQGAADVVAQEASWMIGGAHAVLDQIAATTQTANDADVNRIAATTDALQNFPAPTSIGLYDADGNRQGSTGAVTPPASIGKEAFFSKLKDGTDWAVSPQLAGA